MSAPITNPSSSSGVGAFFKKMGLRAGIRIEQAVHGHFPADHNAKWLGGKNYVAELNAASGSGHCSSAAHVVSKYIRDFILSMIHKPGALDPATAEVLAEEKDLIAASIEKSLNYGLINFFKKVKEKQGDPHFLPDLCASLISKAGAYFKDLHQMTGGKTDRLDYEAIRKKLDETSKGTYAPGMGTKNYDSSAGKNYREENFFKDLSADILSLFFPNGANDLQIPNLNWVLPNYSREKLWVMLKDEWVPQALYLLFKELCSPKMLNSMLLSTLEAATAPVDKKDKADKTSVPKAHVFNDSFQDKLNGACGELIVALSKMFPASITKMVLQIGPFEKAAGNVLGQKIRNFISHPDLSVCWDLEKIIKVGIEKGLPAFHPGVWEMDGSGKVMNFVHRKEEKKDVGGKTIKENSVDFNFQDRFPRTEEEADKLRAESESNENETDAKLRQKIMDILDGTLGDLPPLIPLKIAMAAIWFARKVIEVALGLASFGILPLFFWKKVTKGLDYVENSIEFTLKTVVVDLAWRSTLSFPWRWHYQRQRTKAMKVLHLRTHDLLFCTVAKMFVDKMKE